jgi:hypothetical protein
MSSLIKADAARGVLLTGQNEGYKKVDFALGEHCLWRDGEDEQLSTSSLYQYSSCVTNDACGDAVCDALERLEPSICPQDCANFSGMNQLTSTCYAATHLKGQCHMMVVEIRPWSGRLA